MQYENNLRAFNPGTSLKYFPSFQEILCYESEPKHGIILSEDAIKYR